MSTNELLLLGLLGRQRMHGYELHEMLERQLGFLTDLKKATAYRLLDLLEGQGLVAGEVERLGRRPERRVYRLTPEGRERFQTLLRAELEAAPYPVDPGNVALLFADQIPAADREALLERRMSSLAARRDQLAELVAKHPPKTSARLVLGHELARVDAEVAWLAEAGATVAELESPPGGDTDETACEA